MTQNVIDNSSDSVPWREAFSEYKDEDLPGVFLRGGRYREGLTQKQLAVMIGVPQRHISEMENGKRPIGEEMAKRLGKALNIGYKMFL
jgi:plasmid maintenance system antidote protein VapI